MPATEQQTLITYLQHGFWAGLQQKSLKAATPSFTSSAGKWAIQESKAHLQHVLPVQHEIGISLVALQVAGV